MVNNIFNLEGTVRHHLYFSFLFFFIGFPSIGFAYWTLVFLFYWDEHKVEFLDFDEYLEDCLEAFEFDISPHLRAAREWETTVTDHYNQPGRAFPQELYAHADPSDPSSDYQQGQLMDAFDHPEMYGVWGVAEFLHEDWQTLAEHEIEPTAQHTFDDLEVFYRYYDGDRKIDVAQNNNKHFLKESFYASYPFASRSGFSQKLSLTYRKQAPNDLTNFLWSSPDDFFHPFPSERQKPSKKQKKTKIE